MDGKTFVLHELGHLLGWEHLDPRTDGFQHPEATLMGLKTSQRDPVANAFRFQGAHGAWKHLEYHQVSVYKQTHFRHFGATCRAPSEPLADSNPGFARARLPVTQKLIGRFPDIAYHINFAKLKETILNEMWGVESKRACTSMQEILLGHWPEDTRLELIPADEENVVVNVYVAGGEYGIGIFDSTPTDRNPHGLGQVCAQPGEFISLNLPFLPASDSKIKNYAKPSTTWGRSGAQARLGDGLTIRLSYNDYEDEIKLESVRTQGFQARLYSWVTLRAQGGGVLDDLKVTLTDASGNEVSSIPVNIEIRRNFAQCD